MFIRLNLLRDYFINVIYENPLLKDNNKCINKTDRINLILKSIFIWMVPCNFLKHYKKIKCCLERL